MSLTYSSYVSALSTLTAISSTNADFVAILPSAIDYAEQRLYRELDMLVEDVADSSASTTALTRNFTLPTSIGTFQVVTGVNIITPASTAPESGTRNMLQPASRAYLDMTWPSTTGATLPQFFNFFSQAASIGQSTQPGLVFGPWPDTTYRVEVIGKIIPTALSSSNTTTFLSLYLPDLFTAASMVFMSGYLKNFGAQADDPKQAQSWETQTQILMKSAMDYEARKHFAGASWTSHKVEPSALPQRG